MPRASRHVCNFWIEAKIDGRTTKFAAGPRRADGGFTLRIHQRSKGRGFKVLDVWGIAETGRLTLQGSPLDPNFDTVDDAAEFVITTAR